jgi:two-component system, cell cycle sensor histidine kinase and response regulator CckA
MKRAEKPSHSLVKKFTREYLFVSLIPVGIFFVCVLTGVFFAQKYIADLIHQATYELSEDARGQLEDIGQKIIQGKARDVAKQVDIFLRLNPDLDMPALQKSDEFKNIAMQKVGQNGYTCMFEAETGIMRIHPNPKLIDVEMRFLSEKLPSWWAIFEPTRFGAEVSGYYDWFEPDGQIRKKYMTITPVGARVSGQTLMIAATAYKDEFSTRIQAMQRRSKEISSRYQSFVTQQDLVIFSAMAVILGMTAVVVYLLGQRSARRFIMPIVGLANTSKSFGEGNWEANGDTALLARDDEIGELAVSFDQMRLQLKQLFQELASNLAELESTQAALKKSEAHYRSLFKDLPVGLYRTTPEGRILDANPMLVRMLGYPDKKSFIAQRAEAMYLNSEERAKWKTIIENQDFGKPYEFQMRRYDGTAIWVENHSIAVRDGTGQVQYYEGSLKDISERKAAEVALQKSEKEYRALYDDAKRAEELYRSLLHSSADAIVIYDLQGMAKYVSPVFTKMFGWSQVEVEGKKIPFLPESETETTLNIIKCLVESGTPCHGFETKRYTKDGKTIDVSISASRFEDHIGQPAGILVILRDISDRKRLEEQLHLIQRMEAIGTLAGGIAHDFNNLMMGILGNISLMMCDLDSTSPLYRNLQNVEQLVQSGTKLTGQLLGYARKGKYEPKAVDLNHVIRDSIETFGRTRKEVTINLDLAPERIVADVDRSQIEQVLFNLYINAADAMPRGGELYVQTTVVDHDDFTDKPYSPKPGKYLKLQVTDTGIGMDSETQKRIFDPFFTTKEIGRGTGLGLASVYGIVKSHGGYIDVVSEKGKGTTFCIYLRVSTGSLVEAGANPAEVTRGKGTVLLVDDEEMVIDIGAQMIKKMGYDVLYTRKGDEALSLYDIHRNSIDLVVLDLIMPGMGGGDTFDELKKIDPDVKVLLSSGYCIDGQAREILNRGCCGFIQKPYNMEALSQKINEILTSHTLN